jgi:sarcosine oxidase, subunit alpha
MEKLTQSNRLRRGGRIDRSRVLTFRFNGRTYRGYQGDTLASALLANGVRLVGRSFKYHRPRGIVASGAEEPNAILQIGAGDRTLPNYRATQVELYEGLVAKSVNSWPSLDLDLLALNGIFSRFIPAGFYYKTFMWPWGFWRKYEHLIRKASGLGVAPSEPDPDRYEKCDTHCDVLVIGGGPSGLAAALEAGRSGARVLLADDQSEFGGRLLDVNENIAGAPAMTWVDATVTELKSMPEVQLLPRGTVFGYYDHNFLGVLERVSDHVPPGSTPLPRQRLWRIRVKQVVIATGAFERPLVFHNNDRPGVMLASAVSAYVNRYAVAPGSRAVLFTNNDNAYQTVLDLIDADLPVTAVVDLRTKSDGELIERVRQKGIQLVEGCAVLDVRGKARVEAIEIGRLDVGKTRIVGGSRWIKCDLLAVSGGWNPTLDMHCQSGAKARFDEKQGCFIPGQSAQAERSAGSCNGAFGLGDCLREGSNAGAMAAEAAGFCHALALVSVPPATGPIAGPSQSTWVAPSRFPLGRGPKQFVDLQNDTSVADIVMAVRENFQSIEHVKRYTLLGFGTDQGKLGNVNGIGVVAQFLGTDIASVGTTTFRPGYSPVTFGALAGRDVGPLFDPVRKTPIHQWHVEAGAVFENVGQWKRARYYPQAGETMHGAVKRECLATQKSIGILDYCTLGKIEVKGPDAAKFLNLIYSNDKSRLAIGQCSYGFMLAEDGSVLDDGITARLGENHFFLTTTTGGAANVMAWLERWLQTEWPDLKVYLTSVTDHWTNISINGPNSRKLILELCDDIDFSRQAFPFMSFREGTVVGVPARVFRVSFSGELAYEINVPASYGRALWEALISEGRKYEITPYGTESLHVLRAEKGYVIVGQDTDGSVTPLDLGMNWILAKDKDFLGKRSLYRSAVTAGGRKQLVGLLTEVPDEVLTEGAQIVDHPSVSIPMPMHGHVTSSYFSARLGRSIALALVKEGRGRIGETVYVPRLDGRITKATIATPVFYDLEGKLQNV